MVKNFFGSLIGKKPKSEQGAQDTGAAPKQGQFVVKSGEQLLQTEARQAIIKQMHTLISLPDRHYEALVTRLLTNFAAFVQELPATQKHHHNVPGGLLNHSLEVTLMSLLIRRGFMLPIGAPPEVVSKKAEIWSYATLTAALLKNVGVGTVQQQVRLFDKNHQPLGHWVPLKGPMTGNAFYEIAFKGQANTTLGSRITPLLAHLIMPKDGLLWLAGDEDIMGQWLALMYGDIPASGILGQIVDRANKENIIKYMGSIAPPTTPPPTLGGPAAGAAIPPPMAQSPGGFSPGGAPAPIGPPPSTPSRAPLGPPPSMPPQAPLGSPSGAPARPAFQQPESSLDMRPPRPESPLPPSRPTAKPAPEKPKPPQRDTGLVQRPKMPEGGSEAKPQIKPKPSPTKADKSKPDASPDKSEPEPKAKKPKKPAKPVQEDEGTPPEQTAKPNAKRQPEATAVAPKEERQTNASQQTRQPDTQASAAPARESKPADMPKPSFKPQTAPESEPEAVKASDFLVQPELPAEQPMASQPELQPMPEHPPKSAATIMAESMLQSGFMGGAGQTQGLIQPGGDLSALSGGFSDTMAGSEGVSASMFDDMGGSSMPGNYGVGLPGAGSASSIPSDMGEFFLYWLRQALADGQVVFNQEKGPIHRLKQGILLVTPTLFQMFADANPELDTQADAAAKRFQKLKIHKKNGSQNLYNFASYETGKRIVFKGYLIEDTSHIVDDEALPDINKHLEEDFI